MNLDLEAYFRRIGYAGPATPTLETLAEIHARHVASIPFENLAAFLGEPVRLDLESLQAKLLTPGRGGWCFEQNLYFSHVLEAMGLPVRRLAARVRWNVPPEVTTARSHMLMRILVDGEPYLADVGFGGLTLTAPLAFRPGEEQETAHERHRVVAVGEDHFALEAELGGEWQRMYVFDLQEQLQPDYEVSNWYLSTHPRSQFVRGLIAARAAPECRHALRDNRYTVYRAGAEAGRRTLGTVAELRDVLEDAMHLEVPTGPAVDEKLARLVMMAPSS